MTGPETAGNWRLDWPVSAGQRVAVGHLTTSPEDFRVTESLWPDAETGACDDKGSGEHLCVWLEKTGDNTEYVARELAGIAGCKPFEVGFCGLKDRHAVTRQWFSLYCPGRESADAAVREAISARWTIKGWRRHARKLQRGEHLSNGFHLLLRQVAGDRERLNVALATLAATGAPNYFGPQRFGLGGGNLEQAVRLDVASLNRKRGRRYGGGRSASKNVLYFSAARSWLFNEVLARRVVAGNWSINLPGEPGPEAGPTGPLWGDGGTTATGEQERLERSVVAESPEFERLFQATRMGPERRPLVARADALEWRWPDDDSLELRFSLPPGQYATTILSDIFELKDMSLSRHNKD